MATVLSKSSNNTVKHTSHSNRCRSMAHLQLISMVKKNKFSLTVVTDRDVASCWNERCLAVDVMEALTSCRCCLRRNPDRDLDTPYKHLDKTEIYSVMLAECFDIRLIMVGNSESGICELCVSRLRDASDFKLQVQHSQEELQRLQGDLVVKDESKVKQEMSDVEMSDGFEPTESQVESNDSKSLLLNFSHERVVKVEVVPKVELCFETPRASQSLATSHSEPRTSCVDSPGGAACARVDEAYTCDTCGKEFPKKKYLIHHMKVHSKVKSYICDFCNKLFKHKHHLNDHRRIHTGDQPYNCGTCNKRFSQKSSLIVHKRIHTGEKPHICEICNKAFTQSSALLTHKRTHGAKSYTCDVCGKEFFFKSNFVAHTRIHTGEKPYHCKICKKQFNAQSSLRRHTRIHTGENPYACKTCNKKFKDFSSYSRHERIHTGEKPYICEVCNRPFGSKSHLDRHKQLHTGEKRFCCEICGKQFTEKYLLSNHTILHTKR